ncbi:hypothetical protein [Flagellimonas allohymeniacidonis]|uniref:Type II secretion system protein n=1 Tax=Flagellimonas allohymeniacidonis TaxID=2517819 RepID=A0A4Q8QDM8_9FLAO|nr:hypothetical protein [Allomuricauda hymeniacidonis]TAI48501.1 hypothetical protein EW142_01465 [Allomuricauda hymeniacidonis]
MRKIKASTLMETMVATVLIVVVFMIASLVMNTLMAAQVKSNLSPIKEHLQQLEYACMNKQLTVPYYEEWKGWEIALTQEGAMILIEATHLDNQKQVETLVIQNE